MSEPNLTSVRITSRAATTTVEVGGRNISQALRGVAVSFEADQLPRVALDLLVFEVEEMSIETAEVIVPEDTARALVALGWTPPPGGDHGRT
jgi:DNA polymerase III sliding clamp (beta) subunit (PCNA family)